MSFVLFLTISLNEIVKKRTKLIVESMFIRLPTFWKEKSGIDVYFDPGIDFFLF